MAAHTTDDPTRYRRDAERKAWEAKDPILALKAYVENEGHADAAFFEELEAESETLGKQVREVVRAIEGAIVARTGTRSSTAVPPTRHLEQDQGDPVGSSEASPGEGAQRVAAQGPGDRPQGRHHGPGHRQAFGGVFRITDGLQKDFGKDPVVDTPLAESGIVGRDRPGLRGYPVVEIQLRKGLGARRRQ
ncbi:hypothetical protein STANM309S_06600 [Streptomyces tanashiensis]